MKSSFTDIINEIFIWNLTGLTLEDDAAAARWRGGGGKGKGQSQKSESALSTADVSTVPGASAEADEPFRLLWNTIPIFLSLCSPWQMQMTFSR
jgi:hypothetical protein